MACRRQINVGDALRIESKEARNEGVINRRSVFEQFAPAHSLAARLLSFLPWGGWGATMAETLYIACLDGARIPIDASESGLYGFQLNLVRLENELYSPSRLSQDEANNLREIYARAQDREIQSLLYELEALWECIAIDSQSVDFRTWALGKTVCLPCLNPDLLMTSDEVLSDGDLAIQLRKLFEKNLRGLKSHVKEETISTPIAKELAKDALMQFMWYLSIAYDKLHGISKVMTEFDPPDWYAEESKDLIRCVSSMARTIGEIHGYIEYGYKNSGRKPLTKESENVKLVFQAIEENPRASKQFILSQVRDMYRQKHGREIGETAVRSWYDVAKE